MAVSVEAQTALARPAIPLISLQPADVAGFALLYLGSTDGNGRMIERCPDRGDVALGPVGQAGAVDSDDERSAFYCHCWRSKTSKRWLSAPEICKKVSQVSGNQPFGPEI